MLQQYFKGLDALKLNEETVDIMKNGLFLVSLHGECNLTTVEYQNNKIIMYFNKDYEINKDSEIKLGTKFIIKFEGCNIYKILVQGEGQGNEVFEGFYLRQVNEDVPNLDLIISFGTVQLSVNARYMELEL